MKLGYICTNFNNSHFTVEAVRSLVASAVGQHELRVIVVDNQSTVEHRDVLERLAAEFPCVDLILNDENVGYFPGLNCGIRHARAQYPDIEYFVIGNNDLEFAPAFCKQVEAQRALLDTHAVLSPDIVTLDGEHQNPHFVHSISKVRELIYDIYYSNYLIAQVILWLARVSKRLTDRPDELGHREARHIYQGHGSCYLIGPKFFANFSELWAPTFLMGEEYFLSKQLNDKQIGVYYSPAIQVTHCCHGSLQSIPSEKIWALGRNAHRTYRMHTKIYNKSLTGS
jgi:GT2 family glycosyltransferase